MAEAALAIAAHPDDIEMMMAGTLLLLGEAGYRLHYLTVANGSCGTATLGREEIVAVRLAEARSAAQVLGAEFHEPLVDDLMITYGPALAARLGAVVRRVRPQVLLVPAPEDYMEDHVNTARLAVTAAFSRAMPNFATDPPTAPAGGDVAVYHAMPWGLCDPLRRPVRAGVYVDVGSVLARKRRALACHRSQKEWLDRSQGLDRYLTTMEETAAEVGRRSGRFACAEGWRQRAHLGLSAREDFDPLTGVLGPRGLTARGKEA